MRRFTLIDWLANIIAGITSNKLVSLINNEPGESSGAWADFKAARSWAKDGELKKAIHLTKAELEKEPDSYEGLMLLGSLYADAGTPKLALEATEKLLQNPNLLSQQRQAAEEKKAIYEKLSK